MRSINEDIKSNNFKQAYLLYGDEAYLRKQYKDKLLCGMNPSDDMMNVSFFEGKGIDPKKLIDLGETMPFLAERRIIVVENSGFFKGACDKLPEYLAEMPDYLNMVFIETEVAKNTRMYKGVSKVGRVVEFVAQDDRTLSKWILGRLGKENKRITQRNMELLLEKTGNDMGNIEKEVEKLLCYTMDHEEISAEDIEAICTTQVSNKIFDMIRAISEKHQQKALALYYDLLALKEPPLRILSLISSQFNLILQVKEMAENGYDENTIARKVGKPGFVVRNCRKFGGKYSGRQLQSILEECVSTEEDVKNGRLSDVISVELLLIKYSK